MVRRLARSTSLPILVLTAGCSVVGFPAPAPVTSPTPAVDSRSGDTRGGSGSPDSRTAASAGAREPTAEPRSRSGNPESYEVFGIAYRVEDSAEGYDEVGYASWYGEEFDGRPTSSGEIFDPELLTAAHRSLPLPTWVEVTNLENQRSVVLRVNDRGPFADTERRIIDVSEAAARRLGLIGVGVGRVRVRALRPDELTRGGGR